LDGGGGRRKGNGKVKVKGEDEGEGQGGVKVEVEEGDEKASDGAKVREDEIGGSMKKEEVDEEVKVAVPRTSRVRSKR
jgi:hypothetical protein